MEDYRKLLWLAFSETGTIEDYLKYKLLQNEVFKIEAGEEFGTFENIRNSAEDHQVR